MKRLKNIEISHISLVKRAANGRSLIFKSDEEATSYEKIVEIKKSDEKRGIIYGIVYEPEKEDSQGDLASAEEIEAASYRFMKARNTLNIDKEHDFKNREAFVAESWIVKSGDSLFDCVGAWAVGIKLESEELKEAVKKGEIQGLSMAGRGERIEEEAGKESTLKSVLESFLKVFAPTPSTPPSKEETPALLAALQKSVEAYEGLRGELAVIKKENEELKALVRASHQDTTPAFTPTDAKALAKAAESYMHEQEQKGITLRPSEAVEQILKGEKK